MGESLDDRVSSSTQYNLACLPAARFVPSSPALAHWHHAFYGTSRSHSLLFGLRSTYSYITGIASVPIRQAAHPPFQLASLFRPLTGRYTAYYFGVDIALDISTYILLSVPRNPSHPVVHLPSDGP